MDMSKEYGRMSLETGMSSEDIEKEVKAIIADGYTDKAAIAIWKSNNSGKLGGSMVKDAIIRVVGIEKFKNSPILTSKEGKEYGRFAAFVIDPKTSNLVLANIGVFGDKVSVITSLESGGLYTADVKLRGENDSGLVRGSLTTEIADLDKSDVPSCLDLIKTYGTTPLTEIDENLGNRILVSGFIGKIYEKDDRGMVDISGEGANPITCWVDHNPSIYKLGQEVYIYGRVSAYKGQTQMNVEGIFA